MTPFLYIADVVAQRKWEPQRLAPLGDCSPSGPRVSWRVAGFLQAIVKKALFTLFQCRFSVDVPVPDDLEATGDLFGHEYSFTRGGRTVATVAKRWFSWTDSCGVDITEDEDDILILASTVVIDMACHGDRKQA